MRALVLLLLALVPMAAQPAPALRSDLLVSTVWLAAHLKDPDLVLLHVADTFADYKRGHIPGARYLATGKFIDNAGVLGAELPSVEALTQAFSEVGVTAKSRIVIYATAWMPNAARTWYTLDYLGHPSALLDGGVEQWLAEDRPVTGAVPTFTASTFVPKLHPEARASLEDVQKGACQVVDARPAKRFQAGHLGGAANLYWQETLQSDEHPTFLPPEKLRELLTVRGIVPGRKVLTYCEVGLQASHSAFLFRYLGFDAAMYDGSYQEWTGKNLPVEKGAK